MLHAVNGRKAHLDAFRGPGQRVPLEDVVTSTIFGPLLFIDQTEAEAALSLILSTLGISSPAWVGPTTLSLWPRRKTVEELRSSYVEPDAEIVDAAGNSLVIEVKWGAPLGRSELAAQWLSLNAGARATSRHLLIVLEPSRYRFDVERDRGVIGKSCALPWPVTTVSWRRMADAFREVGRDMRLNPGTRRWALTVHSFLRREDPRSLTGWDGLDVLDVPETEWSYSRRLLSWPRESVPTSWRYTEGWFGMPAVAETHWRLER
jgi:hypothetical protein